MQNQLQQMLQCAQVRANINHVSQWEQTQTETTSRVEGMSTDSRISSSELWDGAGIAVGTETLQNNFYHWSSFYQQQE